MMDKEYFMSCSYNDLKKIAVEHDIFKSIKSKKKDVLLEKLVDYFAENTGARRETFVVSAKNDVDILKDVSNSPKNSSRSRKGKKTKCNDIQIGSSEDDINGEKNDLQEISSRRGTFVIPKDGTISDEISELPKKSNKGRKGKRTRSKDLQISEDETIVENIEVNEEVQEITSRRGNRQISEKGAISEDEISEVPKKSNKIVKGKRTRSKDVLISEDDISDETVGPNEDLHETANRRGTFVVSKKNTTDIAKEISELPKKSNKSRKGKKTKSKDIQIKMDEDDITEEPNVKENLDLPVSDNNRRGTFVVSKKSNDSSEEKSNSIKKSNKGRKGKRTRSKDIQTRSSEDDTIEEKIVEEDPDLPEENTYIVEEKCEPPKKSNKGRKGKKTRSKDMNNKSSEDESSDMKALEDNTETKNATFVEEKSSSSEKNNKPTRGRKARSKEVIASTEDSDLNSTYVLSEINEKENLELKSDKQLELPKNQKRKRGHKTKTKNGSSADLVVSNENIPQDLPKGPVPIINRRGTFSVTTSKPSDSVTVTGDLELNGNILRSQEKKRKQSDSVESFLKENVDEKSTNGNESSPKKLKKVGIVAPVPSLLMNKTVNFITPGSSRKRTPNKNNVTLTPHPIKKLANTPLSKRSVSSPLSVKKTPGTFSAKKMPNFAKIHKKNFEKMESLLAYSERKNVRRDLLSPLNKTFTGLGVKEKIVKKLRNSTGRQPAKSLIPVRSTVIRLEDKEKINSFAKKTHVTNVEAMREKERGIIKGVRANKRFMLQMKMRKIDA